MSEFWKRKIRTYFTLFDLDKDGVITMDDANARVFQFAKLEKADNQKADHLKTGYDTAWGQLLKNAATDDKKRLTAEMLIEIIGKQLYHPELMQLYTDQFRAFFALMNLGYDGYVQEDEYRRFLVQLGVPDASFAKEAFRAIDVNDDGKVSIEEFLNAFFDFLFSQDEKSPNAQFLGPLVD